MYGIHVCILYIVRMYKCVVLSPVDSDDEESVQSEVRYNIASLQSTVHKLAVWCVHVAVLYLHLATCSHYC